MESSGTGARGAGDRGGRRIAVYGEVDPNLIDGSSVWLQSICQVLASIDGVGVTLLLRRPLQPERRFLLDELAASAGIEVVDAGRPELLAPAQALDLLEGLDRERGRFDLLLLRGGAVLTEAAGRGTFDGRLWSYAMPGRIPDETMRAVAASSARVLCQTDAAAAELRRLAPGANGLVTVLPPMIPDFAPPARRDGAGEESLRLVYSGKLAPEYCWLETVAAFRALRERAPAAELHVLGDKIHRPPDLPDFHDEARRALEETEGLRWHGAVPRSAVPGLLADCDLALSIRDPGVESARELSTKVLEYGAAGLPVVLNRAPAYERLLGEGYPFFLDGPEAAADLLTGPALDSDTRAAAAAACEAASREFTFDRVAAMLSEHLPAAHPTLTPPEGGQGPMRSTNGAGRAPRVLIAGHDLKFTDPIREAIASTGARIIEDVWKSHTEHDEEASRAALAQADTILCEWCLGNAAWYSRNKRPDQRLVIRLHRVEAYTDHPAAVEIDNVDKVVCVSQHIADDVIERFGWHPAKFQIIPNSIDVDRFRLPKHESARHTLAMVGYVPKRKRLDRALEILKEVRRHDRRFRLLLVGHPPSELEWVVRDPEEVKFFRKCLTRIQDIDDLRGAISFQPFTDDLPQFFQHVGFILSTSDSEGHQVALAEGAASGAVPVIFDRAGIAEQFPRRWVHATIDEIAFAVAKRTADDWHLDRHNAVERTESWSPGQVLPVWRRTLQGETAALAQGAGV